MKRISIGSLAVFAVVVAGLMVAAPARAQAPGGQAAPPAPPRPSMKAMKELKNRFENEPTVKQVQKAALEFFQVHPEVVRSYRTRAFVKALVPDLEVGFNAERGDSNRNMQDAIYANAFAWKENEDNKHTTMSLNVRAHWALDRLVFNAEVLDVTSLVGVQEGLLREITSLYFTRRRLMTFLTLSPPQDIGEKITERIRLEEITANIDALTGGFFGEKLEKRFGRS